MLASIVPLQPESFNLPFIPASIMSNQPIRLSFIRLTEENSQGSLETESMIGHTPRCMTLVIRVCYYTTAACPPPLPWPPRLSFFPFLICFLSCCLFFFCFLFCLRRLLAGPESGRGRMSEPLLGRQCRIYHACCCRNAALERRTVAWGSGLGSSVLVVEYRPFLYIGSVLYYYIGIYLTGRRPHQTPPIYR